MNRPSVPPTPVSPPVLLGEVRRLRSLLDELARLLDPRLPPGLEALRRDVELALAQPESLGTAENQLDFIEEFADAVWGQPLPFLTGDGYTAQPGGLQSGLHSRVLESWEQLDTLSELLCQDAERWHRRRTAGGDQLLSRLRRSPA